MPTKSLRPLRSCVHASSVGLAVFLITLTTVAQQAKRPTYVEKPPIEGTIPARGIDLTSLQSNGLAGTTVPNWSGSFVDNGITYFYSMLGTDPSKGSASTTVNAILIPVKLTFYDGTVLDPTAPVFGQTRSSVQLFSESPLIKPVAFAPGGTNVGTTQYIDAFQRANFWNFLSTTAAGYHVLFALKTLPVQTLKVPFYFGNTEPGPGNRIGYVNNQWLDDQLAVLMYKLKINTNTIALFLVYDTFSTDTNFTYSGYHSAWGSPPQVYAEFGFYDQSLFPNTGDIMTASHEMAELTDDPFINNIVPSWFNPENDECSDLLEVGDPLHGIGIAPITVGGFIYHPQDLTFLPWFAQETPSTSVNGWYTFGNFFQSASSTCFAASGRAK
jgi:hypothetical protein